MRKEYDDEDEIPERRHSSGKKKKKFGWVNVLTILLVVVLVVLVGVYAVINHYYSKSNYVSDDKISDCRASVSSSVNPVLSVSTSVDLLIGVDRRDKTWYGNSDSMILMSINKDTKQIHMTSFMRDLYANIPDVGVKKLNAACAYGGGPLVVRTIEDNYKLPIDNYASVDFDSMIDIIDDIGGIELSPSDDEIRVANQYVDEMCRLRNVEASAHQYTAGGEQHVDGYQAVAYARIRYVGNSDYQRTERQREVLSKMMQKMKSSSVTELSALADTILPSVTHNIDQSTLMTLIGELPTILSYEIVQSRVPYDDLYSSKGEMLVPDFSATISRLQTEIYGSTTVNE